MRNNRYTSQEFGNVQRRVNDNQNEENYGYVTKRRDPIQ